MKRRSFLGWLAGLTGSTALGVFLYPLIRFLAPPVGAGGGGGIRVSRTSIPVGSAAQVIVGGKPVLVINRQGKGFIALSRVCTHLGCLVDFDKPNNRLLCPCHAGTYNLDGAVLSGPPPAPLQELPIGVAGDELVIGGARA